MARFPPPPFLVLTFKFFTDFWGVTMRPMCVRCVAKYDPRLCNLRKLLCNPSVEIGPPPGFGAEKRGQGFKIRMCCSDQLEYT